MKLLLSLRHCVQGQINFLSHCRTVVLTSFWNRRDTFWNVCIRSCPHRSIPRLVPPLQSFRRRFGNAFEYEFNEDSQLGFFQGCDLRESISGSLVLWAVFIHHVLIWISSQTVDSVSCGLLYWYDECLTLIWHRAG